VSLGDRAAAWVAAWQWVLILGACLALSVWLNVWQWKRALTAPLRDQVAAQGQALDDSAALLEDRDQSVRRLTAAVDRAAVRLGAAGRAYDRAAREQPLTDPACAPGQARIDAVNRAAGAGE